MKSIQNFSIAILCTVLLGSTFTACDKEEECPGPSTVNTELTQKLIGYFLSGDITSFLANCDPACEFDVTGNQILNPGKVYTGNEGFMSFLGDLSAKGQPTNFTPKEFFESGDVVTVTSTLQFTDFINSKTCTVNVVQLWRYKNGKLILLKEDHDNRVCQ